MAKSKKYTIDIERQDDTWVAKIMRQVTSRKTTISKQQGDFASQAEAQQWAEAALAEFSNKQSAANTRQNRQRKEVEEQRMQRSARRAEKTAAAKEAAKSSEPPADD